MLGRKHIICYLLISNLSFFASLRLRNNVVMSLRGKSSFLGADDDSYLNACLRRSIDSCKQCIADGKTLIEVEFPANRKSDLSVSETLDTNRGFTREFVKPFENLGKNLWVVFPDQKESFLAKKDKDWGESCSFTVTSIPSAIQAPDELLPEMIVIVNPGFNVEEWIDVAKIRKPCPMIIINGNLDRVSKRECFTLYFYAYFLFLSSMQLRNGYYPRIFYPGLYKVTQEFYSSATQALFLRCSWVYTAYVLYVLHLRHTL